MVVSPKVNTKKKSYDFLVETLDKSEASQEEFAVQLESLNLSKSELVQLVDQLNQMAEQLPLGENPEQMLQFSERAFQIASQISYEKGQAYSLIFIGVAQWFKSALDHALKNLLESKNIFVRLHDEDGLIKVHLFEACVYRSLGDYDQSYLVLKNCSDFFRKRRNIYWEAVALISLAITCEEIGDTKGVQKHNQRIIDIVTEPGQYWMVGRALGGLGTLCYNAGEFGKALKYFEQSLKIFNKTNHLIGKARALNDQGMCYQRLGDAKAAKKYYQDSLKIRKAVGQKEAQCTCLFNLGLLSMKAGQPEVARDFFSEALATATQVNAKPRISQAHKHLSGAYEKLKNCTNALHHYKLFHEVNEEVFREQSNTRAQNLKTRLELDKAEKITEVERLKSTKLNEKNDELEQLLNELQSTQAQLVQSEKMAALGKLVAGVAHEMNSPLGASSSSIDISERCISKIEELVNSQNELENGLLEKALRCLRTNNGVIFDANERINKIVTSLKSFATLDEAEFQKADIHVGLDSTITLLEAELSAKIKITKKYGDLSPIPCYASELNQVFLNIITNSLEAIADRGEIIVQTSLENGNALIKISDNGIGIPSEKMSGLFEPEFTRTQTRVKAGMGLFVSHNIIQKHEGEINVTSDVGNGTVFTILLPVNLSE